MPAKVTVNFRTVVHKSSSGIATSVPDVCKTPAPPAPPVPIPYPNIARSSDTDKGSKKVKMDGKHIMLKNSKFSTSVGDEAGTLKGIVSSKTKGVAKFALYSFDVKVEGKNVPRLGDMMLTNGNNPNTLAVALTQPNLVIIEIALQEIAIECQDEVENSSQARGKNCREKGTMKHDCCQRKVEEANETLASQDPSQPPGAFAEGAFDADTGQMIPRNNPWGDIPPQVPMPQSSFARGMNGGFSGRKFPDVVVPENPNLPVGRGNCRAVYDFKFTCPEDRNPSWGYSGGRPQDEVYDELLEPSIPPQILSQMF